MGCGAGVGGGGGVRPVGCRLTLHRRWPALALPRAGTGVGEGGTGRSRRCPLRLSWGWCTGGGAARLAAAAGLPL